MSSSRLNKSQVRIKIVIDKGGKAFKKTIKGIKIGHKILINEILGALVTIELAAGNNSSVPREFLFFPSLPRS